MRAGGGLRIVDLSCSTAGRWCTRLFAMAGEGVTRYVPASEAAERGGHSLTALRHAYLDIESAELVDWDGETLARVDVAVADADVVVTSYQGGRYDGPYDEDRVRRLNPDAVHATVSPFGLVGPYSTYRTSSLVDWAAGGYLYISGEPDREPLAGPAELCGYVAGYTAVAAIEAALHARRRGATGPVHLDISTMEAMLAVHNGLFSRAANGEVATRIGNVTGPASYPQGAYQGPDGKLFFGIVTDEEWARFMTAAGHADLVDDERLATGTGRGANRQLVDDIISAWVATMPVDQAAADLQALHVPVTRECTPADILRDAQLLHRGFLRSVTIDGLVGQAPGDPVRTETLPEHAAASGGAARRVHGGDPSLPLAGIVVLDITLWWAGPSAARILGDLGARVIRLERPNVMPGPSLPSQRLVNEKMNRNKLGAAVDLKAPDGLSVVQRLAEQADVIVQNYRPGVLDRLGLGYRSVADTNPGIVYVSLSGFGSAGPKADWGSYGTLIESASSIRDRTHYAGGPGIRLGSQLPDGVGGIVGALAALRGLRRRDETGVGALYDLSQLETYVATSGEGVLAASLGIEADAAGGPDALERVLRCAGDDEWIVVALADGADAARVRARYGDGDGDAWTVLSEVAAGSEKAALAHELQTIGVTAFPVLNGFDLVADAHLSARRFLVDVERGGVRGRLPGSPLRSTTTSLVAFSRPAPALGEHSVEVLRDDLGLAPADIASLVDRRIVAVAVADRG